MTIYDALESCSFLTSGEISDISETIVDSLIEGDLELLGEGAFKKTYRLTEDAVIKVPFEEDTEDDSFHQSQTQGEEITYAEIMESSLAPLFVETHFAYIPEINRTVVIQPRVEVLSDSDVWDEYTEEERPLDARELVQELLAEDHKIGIAEFCGLCAAFGLDDLHEDNVGYLNYTLLIFDWSS